PPPVEPAPRSRSIAPPIVTAVGAVGVGVGVALMFAARSAHDDAVNDPTQRGALDNQASANSLMTAANVALHPARMIAAAVPTWWILDAVLGGGQSEAPRSSPAATLHVGPRSVALSVRF